MSLSNPLDESFDSSLGQLGNNFIYSDGSTVSGTSWTHRDIKSFDKVRSYRTTMADLGWHNLGYLGGSGTAHNFTVSQLQNSSYVTGRVIPGVENWVMTDVFRGSAITLTDSPQTFNPNGGGVVTGQIGPSPKDSYSPALTVTLSGGVTAGVNFISPSGTIDLMTGLNNPNTEYDIVFTIRDVPPQTALTKFSFLFLSLIDTHGTRVDIDIVHYAANKFPQTVTGDVQFRYNRTYWSNLGLDLYNISNVRITPATTGSSGSFTSRFQDLRVIPSGTYTEPLQLVNTATKRFTTNKEATPATPSTFFFSAARPKNLKQNIRFNTGTSPAVVSGTNQFSALYRYQSNQGLLNYVSTTVTSSGGTTNVNLYQTVSGSTSFVANFSSTTLSGSTDYVLQSIIKGNRAQVDLYNVSGAFLGTRIGTTGNKTLPIDLGSKRGLVGFNLIPVNYDFQLAEISMQRAEFGSMTTNPALSFKPVKATQLYTNASGPITLMDQTNITSYGDATLTINSNAGDPAPDYVISRAGTKTNVTPTSNWYGGVVSSGTFFIHDPNELYLAGSLYPYVTGAATSTTYSGTFQVGLVGKDNQIGYVATIPNIVGGQWNNFVLPLNPNVISGKYYIVIRNIGYYAQKFEVDNISLYHNSVSWSAANDGENYIPFYDNINNQYSMLSFPGQHPQIQIKGTALSDTNAWIESWVDKPIYQE